MTALGEEGIFSSFLEETFQFDLEQTTPQLQFPTSLHGRTLSSDVAEIANVANSLNSLPSSAFKLGGNPSAPPAPCVALSPKAGISLKDCATDEDDLFGSPEPYTDGDDMDDDLPIKWEDELSQVVGDLNSPFSDREVPVMDENTKDLLVNMPVKEFNVRTKALKLDNKVLQHLKLLRKRLKNRQAAIRSRSKKENETLFLQKRVDELVRERDQQNSLIKQLQLRLAEVEKKVKSS